jgi:hypothetical protein
MKHNLIKKIFYEWQDYNNIYLNDFIYFNEFLKNKGYQYNILAIGKNNLAIYKVKIDNLSYLITDFGTTLDIQWYDSKSGKYINIYNLG